MASQLVVTVFFRAASIAVLAMTPTLSGCVAIGAGIGATQPRSYYQDVTGVSGLPEIGDEVEVVWRGREAHGRFGGVMCTSQASDEEGCRRWAMKVEIRSQSTFIPTEEVTRVRRCRDGDSPLRPLPLAPAGP